MKKDIYYRSYRGPLCYRCQSVFLSPSTVAETNSDIKRRGHAKRRTDKMPTSNMPSVINQISRIIDQVDNPTSAPWLEYDLSTE